MSEQIVTGKKYKILADATNKVWHVISFISQAVDVFFSNGNNAQTTLGSITGISDSLTSTSSNVAASAASVKALNDKITEISSNLALQIKTGTIAKASTIDTIECGFKPLAIIFTSVDAGVNNVAYIADEANDTYYMYGVVSGGVSKKMQLGNSDSYCIRNVTDTGFTVAHSNYEFTYVAIGR